MKLSQFIAEAQAVLAQSGDGEVTVIVANPSIGPHAQTAVTGIGAGFDWEMGKVIVTTEDRLLAIPNTARAYEDGEVIHFHRHPGEPTEITLTAGTRRFDRHFKTEIAVGDILRIIKVGRKKSAEEIAAGKQLREKNRAENKK